MAHPSLYVVIVANVFIVFVLGDNAAKRFLVTFLSTSIAVTIARPPQRRTYSPVINIEGPDNADILLPGLLSLPQHQRGMMVILLTLLFLRTVIVIVVFISVAQLPHCHPHC
jgi:hypothetical protein